MLSQVRAASRTDREAALREDRAMIANLRIETGNLQITIKNNKQLIFRIEKLKKEMVALNQVARKRERRVEEKFKNQSKEIYHILENFKVKIREIDEKSAALSLLIKEIRDLKSSMTPTILRLKSRISILEKKIQLMALGRLPILGLPFFAFIRPQARALAGRELQEEGVEEG